MPVPNCHCLSAADGLIPGTGHFHVFVDVAEQPDEGEAIPFDDAHKHFGKGQTAADLELTPVSGTRCHMSTAVCDMLRLATEYMLKQHDYMRF